MPHSEEVGKPTTYVLHFNVSCDVDELSEQLRSRVLQISRKRISDESTRADPGLGERRSGRRCLVQDSSFLSNIRHQSSNTVTIFRLNKGCKTGDVGSVFCLCDNLANVRSDKEVRSRLARNHDTNTPMRQ